MADDDVLLQALDGFRHFGALTRGHVVRVLHQRPGRQPLDHAGRQQPPDGEHSDGGRGEPQ